MYCPAMGSVMLHCPEICSTYRRTNDCNVALSIGIHICTNIQIYKAQEISSKTPLKNGQG